MHRHPQSPVLQRTQIPDSPGRYTDVTSVFNPGAVRFGGLIHLLLRVQSRARETFTVHAVSDDGVHFEVDSAPVTWVGWEALDPAPFHIYDPRLTVVDGQAFVQVAMDFADGCRLGLARTEDFRTFHAVGVDGTDTRNGVLFPERIGGRYARLERPNGVALDGGPTSGDAVVFSTSNDLIKWRNDGVVFSGRPHYWDERIGSGPPPIKTRSGWLHLYHGVATHFGAASVYQAGAVLLDLEDPTTVRGRTWENVLEPREPYELMGQVPNVVFPSGWITDDPDADGFVSESSRVRVYYGAADTSVGLATTTVEALVAACRP